MENVIRIKELVKQLNTYRDEYYNKNNPSISDQEYDKLFDELTLLEKETGTILSNSPTQSVGYTVQSKLNKSTHEHPMLSLENKSFCITGSLIQYPNRDTLIKDIELHGGKVVSGVTKKTDYLITNDTTSGSSKNKKAKELNIPIITENQFLEMLAYHIFLTLCQK